MGEYKPLEVFNLAAFSVILILGTIGNAFVIYVYGFGAKRRFMKFERLMLMLGVFDFIASLTNPVHYIYRITHKIWDIGEFSCKVLPALGPIFTSISLGMILIMAIDRDRAVATPLKTQFHIRTIYKAVCINIILCILITIPYIHYTTYKQFKGKPYCYVNSDYTYNVIVLTIFLTSDSTFLLIFVTTTYRVFKRLKTKDTIDCPKMREYRAKETNRILKIIAAMGIMFVLCVFPRDLLLITYSFKEIYPPSMSPKIAKDANNVLKVFHTANSCVNFILYSVLNRKFRREVLRLFMKNERFREFYWSKYQGRSDSTSHDSSMNNSSNTSTLTNDQRRNVTRSLLKHVLTKTQRMAETKT